MLAALAALHLAPPAWAQPYLRVLVVCTEDVPCEAFRARLRGQTSDLPIEIQTRALGQPPLPDELQAAIAAVDALAQESKSPVAVWWRDGAVIALLREPAPGRVLVRDVAPAASASDWQPGSVELEAGSLIARTAIVAAIEGTPIGVPRQPAAGAPPAPVPAAAPGSPAIPPMQVNAALGPNFTWDDVPPRLGVGLEARVAIKLGRLRLGIMWIERRSEDLELPDARGRLDSRQPGATAEFAALVRPKFTLGVEARIGRLISTVTSSTGPFRDPVTFSKTALGIGARVRYTVWQQRALLWAALGLDHILDPITVGLRDQRGFRPVWDMAANQPSLSFGVELLFPGGL